MSKHIYREVKRWEEKASKYKDTKQYKSKPVPGKFTHKSASKTATTPRGVAYCDRQHPWACLNAAMACCCVGERRVSWLPDGAGRGWQRGGRRREEEGGRKGEFKSTHAFESAFLIIGCSEKVRRWIPPLSPAAASPSMGDDDSVHDPSQECDLVFFLMKNALANISRLLHASTPQVTGRCEFTRPRPW